MTASNLPIYFDYAASTPILPDVLNVMLPYLQYPGCLGAPSSPHIYGVRADQAVSVAREQVAAFIHAHADEIIFTSGATESINLALKGVMNGNARRHIVTMQTEHKAVLSVCQWLQKQGFLVTYLKPNQDGSLNYDAFIQACTSDTALCSLMHVNNETGVMHDLDRIGAICRERGILFHVDAAQSFGKLAIDVTRTPIDLLSCTAHKVYGPKGVGALYVRAKPPVRVVAQMHGGGQERNQRSGTLAVHQIVGMGAAADYAKRHQSRYQSFMHELRDHFFQEFQLKNHRWHGPREMCFPNIINLAIGDKSGDDILNALSQFAFSTTSACQGKSKEASHVLRAMGYNEAEARQAIRISFGWQTTMADVQELAWALGADSVTSRP